MVVQSALAVYNCGFELSTGSRQLINELNRSELLTNTLSGQHINRAITVAFDVIKS